MKQLYYIIFFILFSSGVSAQFVSDAYLYAYEGLNSSARYRSMSGAFGTLGGDAAAVLDNPAGGAVFTGNESSFSFGLESKYNSSNFFGSSNENSKNQFKIDQASITILLYNPENGNSNTFFEKLSLGFNYNKKINYENNYQLKGVSPNSIDQYFLNQANGVNLDIISLRENENINSAYRNISYQGYKPQQAFLGYQSYLINPNSEERTNSQYTSNATYTNGIDQDNNISLSGQNTVTSFNISTRIKQNFYIGINLNNHSLRYVHDFKLEEKNFDSSSSIEYIRYENLLNTFSSGFSFQMGVILKVNRLLRLSGTYSSPTWYNVTERYAQSIETIRKPQDAGSNIKEIIAPNIYTENKYNIITPHKLSAGVALVSKKGLISFQYDYKNYSSVEFSPSSDDYFSQLNKEIQSTYQKVSSLRFGSEYRINKVSLRAGVRYEQSPFINNALKDRSVIGYSTGIGYRFPFSSIGISYDGFKTSSLYRVQNSALLGQATLNHYFNNFLLSINFIF